MSRRSLRENADDALTGLRRQVARTIAGNALVLARPGMPAPERQPWNRAAKQARMDEIKAKVGRQLPGHNNAGDAARHAEASRQMADAVGIFYTGLTGAGYEALRSLPPSIPGGVGQPYQEALMDLHNNAEGLKAALSGRAIDPRNLQVRPVSAGQYLRGSR